MEHEFHRELKEQVFNFLAAEALSIATEVRLPNNRIADIIAMSNAAKIIIIEVKTTAYKYSPSSVYEKYGAYCHGLYIALPDAEAYQISLQPPLLGWLSGWHNLGILGITHRRVRLLRNAVPRNLPHERVGSLIHTLTASRLER